MAFAIQKAVSIVPRPDGAQLVSAPRDPRKKVSVDQNRFWKRLLTVAVWVALWVPAVGCSINARTATQGEYHSFWPHLRAQSVRGGQFRANVYHLRANVTEASWWHLRAHRSGASVVTRDLFHQWLGPWNLDGLRGLWMHL